MATIENLAVKTSTKKPNGIIVGSITNTNGVLSSFSKKSYFEILDGRQDNSEYVFKFTLPSTAPSASCPIAHSEFWEAIEFNSSGNIITYDWGAATVRIILSSPTLGNTYWVKSVHSGQLRTYYTSTDGETYTQALSFTDTSADISKNYKFVLGNNSVYDTIFSEARQYTGSIDLNECYIKTGNTVFWNGMDYYEIQKVGGDNFNGDWIESTSTLSADFTLAPGATKTIDLSSYLPDSTYDYEVLFNLFGNTGSTNGNLLLSFVASGSNTNFRQRTIRMRTRTANVQIGACTVIIPILTTDQKVTVINSSDSFGTSTLTLVAKRYRRIGKNGTGSNYISSIYNNSTSYDIGGKALDGEWVAESTQLYSGTLAANGSTNLDLSSILPKDGEPYLCMFSANGTTGTSSGNSVAPRIGTYSGTANPVICRQYTRTSSSMVCSGNVRVPCNNRTVQLYNSGSGTSGTIYVYLRGYRRIGWNA